MRAQENASRRAASWPPPASRSPAWESSSGWSEPSGRWPSPDSRQRRKARSHVAEAVLLPALAHARLVLRCRPHRRRKALTAPLGAALALPVARGVEEHAVPEAGAELRDVAVLERRGRIDRRAE